MRLKTSAMALCLLLGAAGAFSATATLDPKTISAVKLDSGTEVVVKEDHAISLVALDVWFKTGVRDETPENNGASHFIEHMIFKGTAKRSAGQIDREIEDLGGTLGAATSKDWTHFYTVVSREYLETALDVVADAVTNPAFPAGEMEKERSVIQDEIAHNDSVPAIYGFSLLAGSAFTTHPYRFPITGSPDNVAKLKRDQLVRYFREHYRPSNMVVVVVGDVKPNEAVEKVKAAFVSARGAQAKTEPSPKPTVVPAEPAQTQVRRVVAPSPQKNAYLLIGFHAPSVSERPDVYAMDLLMTILGDGGRGRLGPKLASLGVRDKDIQIDFLTQRDPGLISLAVMLTDADKAPQVEAAIIQEFAALAKAPVPENELAYAKALLLGEYAFSNETYAGQAGTLGFYACIDDYRFAVNYPDEITRRTAAELLQTAARYFQPESYTTVLLRPGEK